MKTPVATGGVPVYDAKRMITAVFFARDQEAELAVALSALVGAATDGLIRDVVVVDQGSSDGTGEVADAAGCTLLASGLTDAVAAAKADWILFLSPRALLEPTWEVDVRRFAELAMFGAAGPRAATFRLARLDRGLAARFDEQAAAAATRLFGRVRPEQGLFVPRGLARAEVAPDDREPIALARRLGRLALLRSRAFVGAGPVRPSPGGASHASDARRGAA